MRFALGSQVVHERTTPLGLWKHAKEFAEAARLIRIASKSEITLPTYYLIGHSIELSLKAFLLARGTPLHELKSKKYGHNLVALLTESRRRKLGNAIRLYTRDLAVIHLLNFEYVAKRFEYREAGIYRLPDAALAQNIANRLVDGLQGYCENKTITELLGRGSKA